MKQWMMLSSVGPLYLVASEKGLQSLYWQAQAAPLLTTLEGDGPEVKVLRTAVRQLEEYLDGQRKTFDIPLDISGTPFQKLVWNALEKIPYGSTFSYQGLAKQIEREKAVRAVGTANAKNPICIIVPCHRVIAKDGGLGGYSGGAGVKEKLLRLEQTH